MRCHLEIDLFTAERHVTFSGLGGVGKEQSSSSWRSMLKHKNDKKIFLHIDLTYSFTKAIKHVFIHWLLFYNQAFRFNIKSLEQIATLFTFWTEHLFNFSVSLSWRTQLTLYLQVRYIANHVSNMCIVNSERNCKCL